MPTPPPELEKLTPQRALLSGGQALAVRAIDAAGRPCRVTWRLTPDLGRIAESEGGSESDTVVYIAPDVTSPREVTLVARQAGGPTVTASIALTPHAITIFPPTVELTPGQSVQFRCLVAGASVEETTPAGQKPSWSVVPEEGTISEAGFYTAPARLEESQHVSVVVTTPFQSASATVRLIAPSWTGIGAQALAVYLIAIFSLTFVLVGLWPEALPAPDTARANRIDASMARDDAIKQVRAAELELADEQDATERVARARAQTGAPQMPAAASSSASKPAGTSAPPAVVMLPPAAPPPLPSLAAQETRLRLAEQKLQDAKTTAGVATEALRKSERVEASTTDSGVKTALFGKLDREVDLLLLVLLAGAVGAFIHIAQSYGEYRGRRALHERWAWWYAFRPFVGAALALVFYAAVRGGFLALSSGSPMGAAQLSPFGIASVAGLVGMFSRAATNKLAEVFDTLFKSDANKSADQLPKRVDATSGEERHPPPRRDAVGVT